MSRKREWVETKQAREFYFQGTRYVLPRGKNYADEAFPELSREDATAALRHAHSKYHWVLTEGGEREAQTTTGYDEAE